MQKDFKIGLIVGLVILMGGVIWLSTGSSLSPAHKLDVAHQQEVRQEEQARQKQVVSPATPLVSRSDANTAILQSRTPVDPHSSATAPSSKPVPLLPTSHPSVKPVKQHPAPVVRTHIVQSGETLSDIAFQYYGSSAQWRKIQAANPKLLANPNKIRVGMKLIIPP